MKRPKNLEPGNPDAARVDVVIERIADLCLRRFVDHHPLTAHLRQATGLDGAAIARAAVRNQLKSEKRFWDKTARALKRFV